MSTTRAPGVHSVIGHSRAARVRWLCVLLVASASWGTGCVGPEVRGAGRVAMALGYGRPAAPADATHETPLHVGTTEIRAQGLLNVGSVGYAPGLGLRLGASAPAGFAYDVELAPLGVGALLGERGLVALRGGVVARGTPPRRAPELPLRAEANAALQLTRALHITLAAHALASPWDDAPPDNADARVPFGHERGATLRLRWGKTSKPSQWRDFRWGKGYHVGASLHERGDGVGWEVLVGYTLDGVVLD